MRAVVVGDGGGLSVQTLPDPVPGPGQVVLRVKACGICGTDLHLHAAGRLAPGAVLGHEFAGEVMEGAGGLRAGDRVCALPALSCGGCPRCRSGLGAFCPTQVTVGLGAPGALAEYVTVAAHETVRLPADVDDATGALVEPLAVALHAVNVARVRRGDRCLVLGGGPIGLAIALWARHMGALQVVVSERLAARRARAERLGATHVLDPGAASLADQLRPLLPGGPDVVFEAAGVPGLIQEAISALRFRGRVVVAGLCLGPDTVEPLSALAKEASVHFAMAYEKDDFQYAVDMLGQGRVAPAELVTHRVGLDDVPAVFEALRRPTDQCKVLVHPDRA